MPRRLADAARERCGAAPRSRAELVRCVLDSLASGYARAVDAACSLTDAEVDVVHVVGGGSLNGALCQLAADWSGRAVLAGPVEATSLGNVLVQARTAGAVPTTLDEMRSWAIAGSDVRRFEPRGRDAV
jgi:rhamnulokinase